MIKMSKDNGTATRIPLLPWGKRTVLRISLMIKVMTLVTMLGAVNPLVKTYRDANGLLVDEITVPGIPPEQRVPGPIVTPTRGSVMLQGVPAFNWVYGCSATSAAMLAGYYDRRNYGRIYTGPTNGGVMPLNNSSWANGECPLAATHTGFDGLTGQGHVNRFYVAYNQVGGDPYGTGDPTGTYANCTADYMGTNQQWWGNSDGSTTFYNTNNGAPLSDYTACESASPRRRDGMHGLKLFFQSRGYMVTANYNQYIQGWNGNTTGYTLQQFRTSIDNGQPVLIQLQGHTMLGVGYESTSNTIYVHDTWDFNVHSMTWGGTYSNMTHYAVGVITLAPPPTYVISGTVVNGNNVAMSGVTLSDGNGLSVTTNSSGQYSITVPYWYSGTLHPAIAGFYFSPSGRPYSNVAAASSGQNYTGIINGYVPARVQISRTGTSVVVSWDAYAVGSGTNKVYAMDNPFSTTATDVTSQGVITTVSGRTKWTAPLTPAARRKFYKVTLVTQ